MNACLPCHALVDDYTDEFRQVEDFVQRWLLVQVADMRLFIDKVASVPMLDEGYFATEASVRRCLIVGPEPGVMTMIPVHV